MMSHDITIASTLSGLGYFSNLVLHWQGLGGGILLITNSLILFISIINLGQTNLISGSTDIFQNLKGRSVGKKKKIKKNPQIFALALIINKKLSLGQALHL